MIISELIWKALNLKKKDKIVLSLMPHSEMTKQKLKLFGCGSLTASLFKDTIFRSRKKASAEMIPNLFWAPSFLVPEKFGPQMKMLYNDFQAENKFLGDQIFGNQKSQGPK